MVIEKPAITVEELMAAAADAGQSYTRDTITAARRQALEFIAIAREAGHWKD
jgi:hypothetical protein